MEVDSVKYDDLISEGAEETSAAVKARVEAARAVQRERFKDEGVRNNANMGERQIKKYCRLDAECERTLREAFERLHLSARARTRIIKVARTIGRPRLLLRNTKKTHTRGGVIPQLRRRRTMTGYDENELDAITLDSFTELTYKAKLQVTDNFRYSSPRKKHEEFLIKTLGAGVYNKIRERFFSREYRAGILNGLNGGRSAA